MMIGTSVWESTLQRRIPGESLSRVSSYDWFGSFLFYPLGMALWGPLAAGVGVHTALWLAFGIMVTLAAGLLALPDTRLVVRWSPLRRTRRISRRTSWMPMTAVVATPTRRPTPPTTPSTYRSLCGPHGARISSVIAAIMSRASNAVTGRRSRRR
jgi:hypothetical protein